MSANTVDRPCKLKTLIDTLASCGEGDERVSVGEVVDAMSHRSFGPLLLLPALISVVPVIGALPGVTWSMAALCLIISIHFLFQRQALWLPTFLRDLSLSRDRFTSGLKRVRPWLRRGDGLTHRRFHLMLAPPMPVLVAVLCVVLSLAMFAFSIIPGGVVVPAAGLILLSVGLTTHAGLLLGLGLVTGVISVAGAVWLVLRFIN